MPYVQIPKDLTKVKTKIAFNLTKRQLICFSLAAVIAVPVYFLTKNSLGTSISGLLLIMLAIPFFIAAMYEKNGQPFEKILLIMAKSIFVRPQKRPYKTENIYEYLVKEGANAETSENQANGQNKNTDKRKR